MNNLYILEGQQEHEHQKKQGRNVVAGVVELEVDGGDVASSVEILISQETRGNIFFLI